ncbi:MAG: uncharacterized protein QOD13_3506 [Thermoleophilaceae bacterium]|nr:uncharacterized protein [Thermoleophilaceae bacterium]
MRPRLAGLGIGLVFGIVLSWSGMTSPEVIRSALLFEDSYLFLFFASAVATAAIGLQLLRRERRVSWTTERPARRHIAGSLVFGIGWGVSDACPGPIATQVGQGIGWGLWTLAGVALGVYLFLRRSEDTEPATDPAPAPAGQLAPSA